ncbi:MAG: TetR/AcrR family transcriptional regulator [Proteobacteria bacterium]|nr:TetR/AcrR family transcriptional regulator [Pseudomonadota bacterium]MCP4918932.1 TetR/AcrR family transcriptional regulator [Pseudomonadota bacterium]
MTRHAPQEQREGEILRAARKVFIAKGFQDTRMEDVAKAAGLSKGAVYFYFSSKKILFEALVEQEHTRANRILDEILVQVPETAPAEAFIAMLEHILGHLLTMRSPHFFLIMAEMSARDTELASKLRAVHERMIDRIGEIVAVGIEAGALRPVDPRVVAQILKSCSDGLAYERAYGAEPGGDPVALAKQVVQVFLHGMLPQPA